MSAYFILNENVLKQDLTLKVLKLPVFMAKCFFFKYKSPKSSHQNQVLFYSQSNIVLMMTGFFSFQNETRNQIIEMNLYMEIATLGVTFAACVGSIFGMNLNSGIEEHPFAFHLITFLIVVASCLIISYYCFKFAKIKHSRKTADYPLLKDIFRYQTIFTKSFFFLFA